MERVSNEWINCEIAYLEKRMKFDNSDIVLTSEISSPIIYRLLKEIKEYRKAKKPVTHGDIIRNMTDEEIFHNYYRLIPCKECGFHNECSAYRKFKIAGDIENYESAVKCGLNGWEVKLKRRNKKCQK